MSARPDYELVARSYDRGRDVPLRGFDAWRVALANYVATATRPVLDLGSGTGGFARAIAEWFGVRVIGVEPAHAMRSQARQHGVHPRIAYVAGRAECIPLRDAACSVAWLSTVIHHIGDLVAAAVELGRVVHLDGHVLVRSAFPGRHEHITLFRFFPEARRVADSFPSVEDTVATFARAGFAMAELVSVPQESAPSLRTFHERVAVMRDADSTLAALTDAEFARGLQALAEAAAAEHEPRPVIDRLDLLAFRRRG